MLEKVTSTERSINSQTPCQIRCSVIAPCLSVDLFPLSYSAPLYQCTTMLVWEGEAGSWEKQRDGCGREHLSPVQGLVGRVIVVKETHVDEVDEQTGSVLGSKGVICRPLVEDQQGKVSKQAEHEDDLWDEPQKDVQWLLEVPVRAVNTLNTSHTQNTSVTHSICLFLLLLFLSPFLPFMHVYVER